MTVTCRSIHLFPEQFVLRQEHVCIITPPSSAIVSNPSPSSRLFAEQLTGTRLHHHTFFHSNCLGGNHTPSIAFRHDVVNQCLEFGQEHVSIISPLSRAAVLKGTRLHQRISLQSKVSAETLVEFMHPSAERAALIRFQIECMILLSRVSSRTVLSL